MSRLHTLTARWLTPTNVRTARAALILGAALLAAIHPGIHIPHVLADDESGGP
jgi:hypothetical protein